MEPKWQYDSRLPKFIGIALAKLQSATNYTDPRLAFLTNHMYALGVNALVPLGAPQFVLDSFLSLQVLILNRSQEAGQETFTRCSHLISTTNLPFVRIV